MPNPAGPAGPPRSTDALARRGARGRHPCRGSGPRSHHRNLRHAAVERRTAATAISRSRAVKVTLADSRGRPRDEGASLAVDRGECQQFPAGLIRSTRSATAVPTYQYVCTNPDGKHEFELVQSFTDAPASECPVCGSPVRKVYGSVGVVFKGSGFYRTDSRAGASSGNGSSSSSSTSGSSTSSSTSGSSSSNSSSGSSDSSSSSSSSSSGSAGSAGKAAS